jgi:hypothetical protein
MQAKHHFIKFIVVLLIPLCDAVYAVPSDSDLRVENGVLEVGPDHKSLDSMSAEARAKAIPRIRTLIDDPDSDTRDAATRELLKVDDNQTIQRLVAKYHVNSNIDAARYLGKYGNETTISYLIADVYDKSGKTMQLSEGWNWKEKSSMASSRLILSIIERSDQFPAATRTWAKALDSELVVHLDFILPQVLDQERQWWEHNKQAIAAKQYGSATWVPPGNVNFDYEKELRRNPPPAPPLSAGSQNSTGTQIHD